MFKELIKERDKAKKEYDKINKTVKPYWDKYMETGRAIKKKFIEEKLYIPIDKLKDYLKESDAESLTIVYENGETEDLYHDYGIGFYSDWFGKNEDYNIIQSGTADDGYSFQYNINKEHIVGFYDLDLEDGTEIKETYMEEIIKNLD